MPVTINLLTEHAAVTAPESNDRRAFRSQLLFQSRDQNRVIGESLGRAAE